MHQQNLSALIQLRPANHTAAVRHELRVAQISAIRRAGQGAECCFVDAIDVGLPSLETVAKEKASETAIRLLRIAELVQNHKTLSGWSSSLTAF